MKNRILLILLLISSYCFSQTSVPNTETFSLQDVYNAVHNHTSGTSTNLQSCFDNAISGYFNATYNNNSYAPVGSMLRFRDYKPSVGLPIVTTNDIYDEFHHDSDVYANYVVYGGTIVSDGGSSIAASGIVYSTTNSNPTYGGSGVSFFYLGGNPFSGSYRSFTPGTLYYFRAFAANANGFGYGDVKTFTICTQPEPGGSAYFAYISAQYPNYPATCGGLSGWWVKFEDQSFTVGKKVYLNISTWGNGCAMPNDGYYPVNNYFKVIYITDGVITSISTACP